MTLARVLTLTLVAALPGAALSQPSDQVAFVAANEAAQPTDGKRSELQGIERKIDARDKAVCAAKKSPEIVDWVGTVKRNEVSNGVYSIDIEIGRRVTIDDSILPEVLPRETAKQRAETKVQLAFLEMLKGIRRGDRVVFSGRLGTGITDKCYGASNFFAVDRLDEPAYTIRFSKISRL